MKTTEKLRPTWCKIILDNSIAKDTNNRMEQIVMQLIEKIRAGPKRL